MSTSADQYCFSNKSLLGRKWTGAAAISAAVTAALGSAAARADITNGFAGFNSPNVVRKTVAGTSAYTAFPDVNIAVSANKSSYVASDGTTNLSSSIYNPTPQTITSFDATFTYQATAVGVGGGTFTIVSPTNSLTATGGAGAPEGYLKDAASGTAQVAIPNSVAFGLNGNSGVAAIDAGTVLQSTTPANLSFYSGDPIQVSLQYANNNLVETATDLTTGGSFVYNRSGFNISSYLGSNSTTGIVGFTVSNGAGKQTQTFSNFSFVSAPVFAPVSVSGFNEQGIISVAAGASTVTATMDGGTTKTGDTWYEKGWNTFDTSTGLPTTGSLIGPTGTVANNADTSHSFRLASYSGNDVMLLSSATSASGPQVGTFNFTTPGTYSALSFLTATGGGPGAFKVAINYSDGAQTTTGLTVVAPDWFSGAPYVYAANGRDTTTSSASASPDSYDQGTGPDLYEQDLILPDRVDPISSITLTSTGAGNVFIFAVSGNAVSSNPIVTYTGNGSAGAFDSSTVNFKQTVSGSTTATAFANGETVVFDDTATDTAHNITVSTVSGPIAPFGLLFNGSTATAPYNLGGAAITGTGYLTVGGTGTVNLLVPESFTGSTTVNNGTLVLGSSSSLASSTISVGSTTAATLQISAGAVLSATSVSLSISSLGTVNVFSPAFSPTALTGTGTINLDAATGTTLTLGTIAFGGTINGNNAGTGGTVKFTSGGTFTGTINDGTANGNDYPVTVIAANTNPVTTNPLVFNGQTTYSGGVYLNAGLVQAGQTGALGYGNIYFNGGSLGGGALSTATSTAIITNPLVFNQASGLSFDATNYVQIGYASQSIQLPGPGFTPITVTTTDTSASKVQIASPITDSAAGPSGITATGSFAITAASTYSGGTVLNTGADVATNSSSGFGTGPIIFNGGGIGALANSGLTNTANGAIANPYLFGSNTAGATAAGLLENGVAFELSGPGFFGYGATYNAATGTFTGGTATTATFTVTAPSAKLSGNISGGALVLVNGSLVNTQNILELAGAANTFTGPITISASGTTTGTYAATLQVDDAGALGGLNTAAGAIGIVVNNGGSLQVGGGDPNIGLVGGLPITIQIAGTGSTAQNVSAGTKIGAVRSPVSQTTTSTFAGNIVLTAPATVGAGGASTLVLAGNISGVGPLTVGGNYNSSTTLAGNNTYTGGTTITGEPLASPALSTFKLGSTGGFSPAGGLTVNAGKGNTVVDLAGFSPSLTYLAGTVGSSSTMLTNSGTTPSLVTITNGNTATGAATFPSVIADGSGIISILKTGTGNQTLSGANAYSGGVNISGGTLTAGNATALGSGPVNLNGGTLSLNLPQTVTVSNVNNFQLNNGNSSPANQSGGTVNLTPNSSNVSNAAFYPSPVSVSDLGSFTASFTYTHGTSAEFGVADGIAFVLENDPRGASAVGGVGGAYGYGSNGSGLGGATITKSAAVEINIYGDTTSFGTNGSLPSANNLSFASTDSPDTVSVAYNGPAKTVVVTIVGTGGDTQTNTYTGIDIATLLNGAATSNTASGYIGVTGATGGNATNQSFSNFTFTTNGATGGGTVANSVFTTPGKTSAINVVANSGAFTGGVGPLTLGAGSQLNVSGSGTTNLAYTLATGAVTLPAVSTIDVASNGTGSGTLFLGALNDGGTPATLTIQDFGTVALTASATSLVTGSMLNVSAGSTLAVNTVGATELAKINDAGTVSIGAGVGTTGLIFGSPINNLILNGNALTLSPATPLTVTGTISDGSAAGVVNVSSGSVSFSGTSTYTGATTVSPGAVLTVTGSLAPTGSINANGTVVFTNPGSLLLVRTKGVISVGPVGQVTLSSPVSHSARQLLVASGLNITAGGTLNLTGNDLDLTGSTETLTAVTQLVAMGYNPSGGGNWSGPGINSSMAGSDSLHLTALGVIQNNQGGTPLFTASGLFDGTAPGVNDILVKYTYFGDANLDGKIDGSDYSLLDGGYASAGALSGWYHGDFNYDGVIDGSDYALIDNTFNNQAGPLTTPNALVAEATVQVAGSASPAAVPEPASLGGILIATFSLTVRRRRDR